MNNKKRRSCLAALLSFLLSIVLIAALLLAIPVTLLRYVLTDRNIELIVDHVIDSFEIDKIEFETEDGAKNISGIIYDATSEIEELDGITEEHINEILTNGAVKDFAADILKQYGTALKEGTEPIGLQPDLIYTYIQENHETIEELAKETGYEGEIPIEAHKKDIISNLESEIGSEGITVENLIENNDENAELFAMLEKAQRIFSDDALYLAWGIVAFIAILLFLINLGFFGSFCRSGGIPAFITGGIYSLIGLAVTPALSLVEIPEPMIASAVEFTAGFIGALLMDISVPVLGVGLALIVISFISDAIARRRES